jgi:hypothetical protein
LSLIDILEATMGPSEEEMREHQKHVFKRIRFAFNGEDGDSVIINRFLDLVEQYGDDINKMRTDGVYVSKPVHEELVELAKNMGGFVTAMERLASVRLQAQGRRFDDRDGPDYVPPSADNPESN